MYASPDRAKRKYLWTDLMEVLPPDLTPWLILGDFNAILSLKDKKSDRSMGKRCKLFGNFVESCNIQDLGFIGPAFTWQRGNIADFLSDFTSHVKDWNRSIYEFLGTCKRYIMRSLSNIQKAMDWSSSSRMVDLEMEVRNELENVLNHEGLLWRQKARCDWLQFGDCNTKYFHSHTMKRRKFNHIMALHISSRE
ncbi:hypothetical protein PVK06_043512 [Gossypium arboreum]|uniref:Reverse transcriptase n=1 Tax=Gossypium arboreum TaxID=29729 RepID=A0ABR0MP30_GOSAR|nr:hypothetical protein PVK06_043512 [Gossypium arboreum]